MFQIAQSHSKLNESIKFDFIRLIKLRIRHILCYQFRSVHSISGGFDVRASSSWFVLPSDLIFYVLERV